MSEVEADDPFSLAGFEARARARLLPDPPAIPQGPADRAEGGDHRINPGPLFVLEPLRPAAVLVPLVDRPDGATVLLTRRSSDLRSHSGQVAFPGGKIDPEDDGPLGAALREAEEEIGLDRSLVTPLGFLESYLTGTGFRIVPVVGRVPADHRLTLNPQEVDLTFEVPLAFLMTPDNHLRGSRDWNGTLRHFYAMPFGDHNIWGVTAGILRNLYERLYAP